MRNDRATAGQVYCYQNVAESAWSGFQVNATCEARRETTRIDTHDSPSSNLRCFHTLLGECGSDCPRLRVKRGAIGLLKNAEGADCDQRQNHKCDDTLE